MTVTVLTPTCGRPSIQLLQRWLARQTRQPDVWLVVDGCDRPPGVGNFLQNLATGLATIATDALVIAEDDDWWAPTHLEGVLAALESADLVGSQRLRYYHVPQRCWRVMENTGSALGQTALRASAYEAFAEAIRVCQHQQSYGVDVRLWQTPVRRCRLPADTVVGLKGLSGAKGLGIGHRPRAGWTADPSGDHLREWIGADAEAYLAGV